MRQRSRSHPIAVGYRFIREVLSVYRDCHLARGSAAVAYYLLLALFPMAVCVSVLLYRHALMPSLWYEALHWLDRVFDAVGGTQTAAADGASPVLFFAALTLLLSASAGAFRCLYLSASDIVDKCGISCFANKASADRSRISGVFGAVIGYLFAAVLFFAVCGAVFLLLLWEELTSLAAHHLGAGALTELLFASRYLVMLLLFFCLCLGLLRILPPNVHGACRVLAGFSRPTVLPGAVFCTAGLSVSAAFFALFMRKSAKYSLVYGSLASVILFLMWLFVCAGVILIGVAVNAVRRQNRYF